MGELLTYSLADFIPFSRDTYHRLFELYNDAVWPAHIVALLLGVVLLALLRWGGGRGRDRLIAAIIAAAWLWVAVAFHLARYESILLAAPFFAYAFAAQAGLFLLLGTAWGTLRFPRGGARRDALALALIVFALAVQPLVGLLAGRALGGLEVFGLAAAPTVVATLGLLLLARGWARWPLLLLPVLWAVVEGALARVLEAWDGFTLAVVTVVALLWLVRQQLGRAVARPTKAA